MPSCNVAPGTPRLWYCVGCVRASSRPGTPASGVSSSTAMLLPLKYSTPATWVAGSLERELPIPGAAIHGCVNCALLRPSRPAIRFG